MKPHHGIVRVGRVARWQRWTSHLVLGGCAASGVVWFVLLDLAQWAPPRVVAWWVMHGLSGLLCLGVIGMALPHHVVATWRNRRNRWAGALAAGLLGALALTALLLLYGPEQTHGVGHWVHVGLGLAAVFVFPWHVLRGRRSVGQVPTVRRGR